MITLATITLAAPEMLLGVIGLALPIAAHLLHRRVSRRVVFPTVRFLHDAASGHARVRRFRAWVVFLLRCLAVLCLVGAFAQPVWFSGHATPPLPGRGVGVVLVVDNSVSSRQVSRGVSLIDSLRTDTRRVLGELRAGVDEAGIVYAAPSPVSFLPRLTPNIEALRQETDRIAATDGRSDFPGALALAGDLLEHHDGPRRIVILSDIQATNWADLAKTKTPDGVPVTVVPIGSLPPPNMAICCPRVFADVLPVAGQPVPVVAEVQNFSDAPALVRVSLRVDDSPVGFRDVTVPPWKSGEAVFDVRLPSPGWHALTFSIPSDPLEADNTAYLAVHAVERVSVVIVSDDGETPASGGGGAYFLSRAAMPFDVRLISSREVDAEHLRGFRGRGRFRGAQVVFIDRIDQLTPAAADVLGDDAARGGGLMVFCGPRFIPANLQLLNGALRRRGLPVFPVRLETMKSLAKNGDAFHIAGGDWQGSPLLHDFDERARIALERVSFTSAWSMPFTPGSGGDGWQEVLRFDDNTPALLRRDNLALANFSPAADAGDLGKHGIFVALTRVMIEQLPRRSAAPPAAEPGKDLVMPVTGPIDADAGVAIVGPDGRRQPVKITSAGDGLVRVDSFIPGAAGIYRLVRGGETIGMAGINIDPRESDLRRDDPAAVASSLAAPHTIATMDARADDPLDLHGYPLWPWLVGGTLAALGVELGLMVRWKR